MERLVRHDGESRDTDRPTWSHIDDSLEGAVQVTVIATGFGGQGRRRKRREPAQLDAPVPATAPSEGFDMSHDVLEVPSFLRDDS